MKFNSLIPELSVTDISKSLAFYQELGFQVKYQREEYKFYFLELEENQLMIEQINEHWNVGVLEYPFGRGINISMTLQDIDAFYEKVKSLKIPLFQELSTQEYRVQDQVYLDKEFLLQDPDGYLLRFSEDLGEKEVM